MSRGARTVWVVGIDLAGPANAADTVACVARAAGDELTFDRLVDDLDDRAILDLVSTVPTRDTLVVGLDAPLSYQPGGGDRPGDKALRAHLTELGLASGTVMTPTMTRMAYLTLRGIAVSRAIASVRPGARIVEVHPAGALVTRGADAAWVRDLKRDPVHLVRLAEWISEAGLDALSLPDPTDHALAACAAVLAAADWYRGQPTWRYRADSPLHPFDFVC